MSILVIGDSFSAPDDRWNPWPVIIGNRLNIQVINRAIPGSGYQQRGIGPQPAKFCRQLLLQPPTGVKLVIFFGSVNDRWIGDKEHLRHWIFVTHREAARTYPAAKQLIIGPQWAGVDPVPQNVIDARTTVLDAMWDYDWQHPMVDPIHENWFPQNDLSVLAADKFHPNQNGHIRMADKLEARIRALLGL
jgi:hypothetical protein